MIRKIQKTGLHHYNSLGEKVDGINPKMSVVEDIERFVLQMMKEFNHLDSSHLNSKWNAKYEQNQVAPY